MSIPIDEVLSSLDVPRLVIMPAALYDAINAKLDVAISEVPDAAKDRNLLYGQLVAFFDEYGYLPEFTLGKVEKIVSEAEGR